MPNEDPFLSLRIKQTLLNEIDARASDQGVSRSAWVRARIMEGLGKPVPPSKPHVAGKKAADGPSEGDPTEEGEAFETDEPPQDFHGRCVHPTKNIKQTSVMRLCTLCGSRLPT